MNFRKNETNRNTGNDTNNEYSIENLNQISFFKFLSQEEWITIKENISELKYKNDDVILFEGDKKKEKQGIYVVSSGSVSVTKSSHHGRYYHVRVLELGEVFINPGLFDGGPSPATLKAIGDTKVFYISREVILPTITKDSSMSEGMYLIIAEIIRSAISVIDDLAFKDNYRRLASFLINVSKNDIINRQQFTLQFISSCINTVPEVVSRELKKMADEGLIEITRTKIFIVDRQELEEVAS